MMRRALVEKAPEVINGFRMRGTEVSRMEAFVDCVFGFGLTLLVVSSQVPEHFNELLKNLRQFVVFGLCFILFFSVWFRHYTFCRRFGLEDMTTRVLTVVLLFVMLAYLYPLKFLTVTFVSLVLHIDVGWTSTDGDTHHLGPLFVIYGAGFAAIQVVFALLYLHAHHNRRALRLDELEVLDTRWWTIEHAAYALVPLLSIGMALVLPEKYAGLAGYAYFFMGLVGWIHGTLHSNHHRAMVEKMESEGHLVETELSTENDLVEVTPG